MRKKYLNECWKKLNALHLPLRKRETFGVIKSVHDYRMYWKPKKVKLILLAESHVFTEKKDYKCRINNKVLELHDYPINFVRFVYCLGYGENGLLWNNVKGNNKGTPQYWEIFFSCLNRIKDNINFSPILKKGTATLDRIRNKINLLNNLKKKGIWLLDASIIGIYNGDISKQNYCHILQTCWDNYNFKLIKKERPGFVLVIGKGVHDVLSKNLKTMKDAFQIDYDYVNQPQGIRNSNKRFETFTKYYDLSKKNTI